MKLSFFLIGLALAPFVLSASAAESGMRKRAELSPSSLKFTYETFDGGTRYACKHQLASDASPYDWKVQCFEGSVLRREYVAHVSLDRYARASAPELSIELLYWLTGTGVETEAGSTTWFRFAKSAPLMSVSTSQTVDQGTAGLYLDITLP